MVGIPEQPGIQGFRATAGFQVVGVVDILGFLEMSVEVDIQDIAVREPVEYQGLVDIQGSQRQASADIQGLAGNLDCRVTAGSLEYQGHQGLVDTAGLEFQGFQGLVDSLDLVEVLLQILGTRDTQVRLGIQDIQQRLQVHLGSQGIADHFLELQGLADILVTPDQEYLVSLGILDAVDLAGSLDVVVIPVSVDSVGIQDSADDQDIQVFVVQDVADIVGSAEREQAGSRDIQADRDFLDTLGSVV